MTTKKLNLKKIHKFWERKAVQNKTNREASWGDLLMNKEAQVIINNLEKGNYVLDIGCANGFSSIKFVNAKEINLVGIDYVPEMIKFANIAKRGQKKNIQKRLKFEKGDVLKLQFKNETFDKINMTRCLCNLTSFDNQAKAITEAWRVLKPGGVLLISEPTIEGLKILNNIGRKLNLRDLEAPWHNLYLDESKLLKLVKPKFEIKIDYFSSTYYLLSRIIYRRLMGDNSEHLKRNSIFNKLGLLLPPFGDWGVQRLYILTKK